LSGETDVAVAINYAYEKPGVWDVEWTDGPTVEQLRGLVADALDSGRHREMVGQRLNYHRGRSDRGWAARAIAALLGSRHESATWTANGSA
jgi:hypothetical protein